MPVQNNFNTPSILVAEVLRHMQDNLIIGSTMYRDMTTDFTSRSNGHKVGDSISIITAPDYVTKDFTGTIVTQDIRNSTRAITIEKHYDISVSLTSREMALEFDDLSRQVLAPIGTRIAESIDAYLGTKILQGHGLYNHAAATGTNPTGLFYNAADMALARAQATNYQISLMDRVCLVDDVLEATLLGADYFNQVQIRGANAPNTLEGANLGRMMGMNFWSSVNYPTTSRTANSGTTTTNNTGTTNLIGATTLTVDSVTTGYTAGDHIMVAGLKRPMIVASDVVATATAIPLVDPITELVPDGVAVTVIAAGETTVYHGAIYTPGAFAYAMPPLDLPDGNSGAVITSDGFSMRLVTDYNVTTKTHVLSIDCLVGAFCADPRKVMLISQS